MSEVGSEPKPQLQLLDLVGEAGHKVEGDRLVDVRPVCGCTSLAAPELGEGVVPRLAGLGDDQPSARSLKDPDRGAGRAGGPRGEACHAIASMGVRTLGQGICDVILAAMLMNSARRGFCRCRDRPDVRAKGTKEDSAASRPRDSASSGRAWTGSSWPPRTRLPADGRRATSIGQFR